jgi:hypothetical protein
MNRYQKVIIYEENKSNWAEIVLFLRQRNIPCYIEYDSHDKYGVYLSTGIHLFEEGYDGYCFCEGTAAKINQLPEKHNRNILFLNQPIQPIIPEKSDIAAYHFPTEDRILTNEEIRDMFMKSLTYSTTEVDIASPWINNAAVNDEILMLIKNALERKVRIKISFGIGEQLDARNDKSVKMALFMKSLFQGYGSHFKIHRGNSHFKLLICDTIFTSPEVTISYHFQEIMVRTPYVKKGLNITPQLMI